MSQADSLRHIADLYGKLEARCDELNEACSVKQVLIDNTASDLRDMRDLYEKEKDELRSQLIREHLSRLSSDEQMRFQIKRADTAHAAGFREGVEASAKVVDSDEFWMATCEDRVLLVRALSPAPAKDGEGEAP